MPSYRELLKLTGLKSTNAIYKLINKWVGLKFIKRDGGRLALGERAAGLPLLGSVAAGWPSPAEEELADTIGLEEWLIKNREATYLLKASGDSMLDAGIHPGDMLLVERGRDPKEGDIVVAEVDKQWTLKYFRKRGNQIILYPANKKYQPIVPKEELNIAAVVTAVIRKYKS